MKKHTYILLFFIPSVFFVSAQKVEVNAKMDTNFILIGEQTQIELSINYKVDEGPVNITFPQLKDTINEFIEIVNQSPIDTVIPDKNNETLFKQFQTLTITSFDSGYYAIPPFLFVVNNDTLATEAFLLEVQTVAVDTTQAIFDIKTPMGVPFSIVDWIKTNWMWLIGIFILIIVIFFIIRFLKKKPTPIKEKIKPDVPMHIIALQELEKIKEQKLWQAGKVKAYHTQISEVLRNYIERRYQVNALEETTDEILHGLRLHHIPQEITNKLSQTLVLSDLVKFAKEKPLPNENDMSIINAIEFVNNTKIITPENAE